MLRWRDQISFSPAQFGDRRDPATLLRLRRRGLTFLEALCRACHGDLVRGSDAGWNQVLPCRDLVRLCEPAAVSVLAGPLVLSDVHLDAFPLAGLADRAGSCPNSSGPCWRARVPF